VSRRPAWRRAGSRLVVSLGGVGELPRGPATAGSLVAALAWWRLELQAPAQGLATAAATLAGAVCAGPWVTAEHPDPNFIVIDELAGTWTALYGLPVDWRVAAGGAIVFRLLDKRKPGPVGLVDRKHGAWWVMADDLVAGLLANAALRIALWVRSSR
jgi:phosphatidylglycerophosphatase A